MMKNNSIWNYSVLMSVYDNEKKEYLIQSIESMLNQTLPPEQFVIVEDGNLREELQNILDIYRKNKPDIVTLVKIEENVGLGKALDEGMKYCRNELIARMDSDDISKPERCEKQIEMFQNDPGLVLVGSNIDEFYDNPQNIRCSRVVPASMQDIKKVIGRKTPFNHPTVMYKKSEVIRCGGYGNMRRKQDRDLFSRMINMNCKAANINESLLLFRSNEDNYKRRKSWEYCKSTIDVSYMIWKRKDCTLLDLVYTIVGQMILFFAPMPLMKLISDNILRKKIR